MAKGKNFKNQLEPKDIVKAKNPWDFDQPEYDERSSCYVNAGSHYGLGHRQPVGSKQYSSKGGVPVGKSMGMTIDEIPAKNLTVDLNA
jgi:hypothetical protein